MYLFLFAFRAPCIAAVHIHPASQQEPAQPGGRLQEGQDQATQERGSAYA